MSWGWWYSCARLKKHVLVAVEGRVDRALTNRGGRISRNPSFGQWWRCPRSFTARLRQASLGIQQVELPFLFHSSPDFRLLDVM